MEELKNVTIFCVNDGKKHEMEMGTSLKEISDKYCKEVTDPKTGKTYPVLAVLVDNKLKDLEYPIMAPHQVEFLGYNHADGRRCYIRSLCFVLQKVVRELYPDKILIIDHSLPSGLYCEIHELDSNGDMGKTHFVMDDEIEVIKTRMEEVIADDITFQKKKVLASDAEKIFLEHHQKQKAGLLESLGRYTISLYSLYGLEDTFYGPLVPSTGYLTIFDVKGFGEGLCLQSPMISDTSKVMPMRRQSKIAGTLKEYSKWCTIMDIEGVGSLNSIINSGGAIKLINISEAAQERKYAEIADQIFQRRGQSKIVFIAGPSSSGKTSSSLRLAQQCKVLGLNPKVIELDNYFVDRSRTPKDEDGNYDFESLYAMDLDLLNSQLNDLLAGKEVEIPRFDFKAGEAVYEGNMLKLDSEDILIMEGIHALNPEMTSAVDDDKIFRVYVSALTSLNLDENNNISTSDNRLLRRMVRDNRVRGITPEQTLTRWYSVRRGEQKNIFPFQENADAILNSALIYELPLLKYYVEPLLQRITPLSEAYAEAARLLKFLSYISPLQPSEIEAIPPTSIMREFIGGQTLSAFTKN